MGYSGSLASLLVNRKRAPAVSPDPVARRPRAPLSPACAAPAAAAPAGSAAARSAAGREREGEGPARPAGAGRGSCDGLRRPGRRRVLRRAEVACRRVWSTLPWSPTPNAASATASLPRATCTRSLCVAGGMAPGMPRRPPRLPPSPGSPTSRSRSWAWRPSASAARACGSRNPCPMRASPHRRPWPSTEPASKGSSVLDNSKKGARQAAAASLLATLTGLDLPILAVARPEAATALSTAATSALGVGCALPRTHDDPRRTGGLARPRGQPAGTRPRVRRRDNSRKADGALRVPAALRGPPARLGAPPRDRVAGPGRQPALRAGCPVDARPRRGPGRRPSTWSRASAPRSRT